MSWPEVKKINSDLSTPLNELITKPAEIKQIYSNGIMPHNTELGNILDIRGKGLLLHLHCEISNIRDSLCRIQLIIDNEEPIFDVTIDQRQNTRTYVSAKIDLLTDPMLCNSGNNPFGSYTGTFYVDSKLETIADHIITNLTYSDRVYKLPLYFPITYNSLNPPSGSTTSTMNFKDILWVTKPIVFKESLRINTMCISSGNIPNTLSVIHSLND